MCPLQRSVVSSLPWSPGVMWKVVRNSVTTQGGGDALGVLFVFNMTVCSSQSDRQAALHSSTKPCICNEFPVEMEIALLITRAGLFDGVGD